MRKTRLLFILLLLTSLSTQLFAQKKKLSLEDFFVSGTFATKNVHGLRSMNDGEHYTLLENDGKKIVKYSYKTGKSVATLWDAELNGRNITGIQDYQFNQQENLILLTTNKQYIYRRSYTADYYLYDTKNKSIKPLSEKGPQQAATFSPDGYRIAFVRNNNLSIYDVRFGSERQITTDGKYNHIINGMPDWVYEEEFGLSRAFEWAPDGSALAYLKFDESEVKEFHMNLFEGQAPAIQTNELYPSVYTYKYPKAGEKNSIMSVHVYDLTDRLTVKMDIGEEKDIYIPRIRWTTDPKRLTIIRLNRRQNKMEILSANSYSGKTTLLYREENPYYIDDSNFDNLFFMENGNEFVISSEKSGYMHLYLYDISGKEKQAITSGNFDVTAFHGYNPVKKLFYYESTEESPLERYTYAIDLNGKKTKLTTEQGWNNTSFSKNFKFYINTVSRIDTPPLTVLYDQNNKQIRVLENNNRLKETINTFAIAKKEFIQIPAADNNIALNAWIIKPLNFNPVKKYPVLITQYSGPNSQRVKNAWGGVNWLDYLAQEGYIVVCVDPRGTAARGQEFRKCTYMQLGKIESDDLIAVGRWLGNQSYADSKKIGIWGWSFGGFMSSLCLMKGNDVFSTAIAVAPVTHFKYYDTVYTERFMRTPQENKAGYDDHAPLNWASRLKGNLLLCHGTADDNVHVQNTYELAEKLVQAGKQFDMGIYTNRNHGIYGGNTSLQLYTRFVNYLNTHLKGL